MNYPGILLVGEFLPGQHIAAEPELLSKDVEEPAQEVDDQHPPHPFERQTHELAGN